jgi:hypothetical protein
MQNAMTESSAMVWKIASVVLANQEIQLSVQMTVCFATAPNFAMKLLVDVTTLEIHAKLGKIVMKTRIYAFRIHAVTAIVNKEKTALTVALIAKAVSVAAMIAMIVSRTFVTVSATRRKMVRIVPIAHSLGAAATVPVMAKKTAVTARLIAGNPLQQKWRVAMEKIMMGMVRLTVMIRIV